ncbi:MAG: hypothetical protein ILO36_01880 [Abditibacteriota bacterium]|nr:hypothetical protein [Abditibacteriota bacterium]
MAGAKKSSKNNVSIPLIVIIILIVLGIGFVISSGHREGQRSNNTIPPPDVKPVPELAAEEGPAPESSKPETKTPPERVKPAPPAAEQKEIKQVKKAPAKTSKKKDPLKASREEKVDLLNKFDRKANENAAKAVAEQPAAPAETPAPAPGENTGAAQSAEDAQ